MKKLRLEAETGPYPRDGPRRWEWPRERQTGARLLSRRGCRRRGSLSHARNVPTFATSPNGAPGRFPVTPREVIFSPLFPAATSRHRVSLRVPVRAWPGSCLNVGHVGETRDICPEHPRARPAGPPVNSAPALRAGARSPIGAAPFFANMSLSSPDPLRNGKVGRFHVIQIPTYRVEKPGELAKPTPVYPGVAARVREGTCCEGRKCRCACQVVSYRSGDSGERRREWR